MLESIWKIKLRIVVFLKLIYYKLKYKNRLKIGKKNKFRSRFKINISKEGYLEIGDGNFWNDDCSINVRSNVKIGNRNLFGKNVNLYDHNHIFDDNSKKKETEFYTNEIKIGNENWFGTNATILSKAEVGNKNVISAGTIINMKIPNECIVKPNNELKIKKIIYK